MDKRHCWNVASMNRHCSRVELAELPDRVTLALDVGPAGLATIGLSTSSAPGQKSTAILLLIMQASHDPLLIDQPEDDLDNRFIYDDIVQRFERRSRLASSSSRHTTQTFRSSVMRSRSSCSTRKSRRAARTGHASEHGSIDITEVRDAAEHILEGGREAFALRQAKIGCDRPTCPGRVAALVAGGEDSFTEFKAPQVSPRDLAKELCAFSNSAGAEYCSGSTMTVRSSGRQVGRRALMNVARTLLDPPIVPDISGSSGRGHGIIVVSAEQGSRSHTPSPR